MSSVIPLYHVGPPPHVGSIILAASIGIGAEPANRPGGAAPANVGPSNVPPRRQVTANKPVADVANPSHRRDQQIAEWLMIWNQKEIALARSAASKTENQQVRHLAEMLEKDHSQCLAKLQRFAGPAGDAATPAANNASACRR